MPLAPIKLSYDSAWYQIDDSFEALYVEHCVPAFKSLLEYEFRP